MAARRLIEGQTPRLACFSLLSFTAPTSTPASGGVGVCPSPCTTVQYAGSIESIPDSPFHYKLPA